jgi:hypothetical protein
MGSYTTSGQLYKPTSGEAAYASSVNGNFDVLDEQVRTPMGQVLLVKSGSNLLLQPYKGNRLMIAGINRTVASSGVSLAPTALSANTTYMIYAYWTGSAVALEASSTAHATDSTYGHEIKSGDATRALVGMARIITGPAWVDTEAQRFVLSWHNRRDLIGRNIYTTLRWTASTTFVEVDAEIRCQYLSWSDEVVDAVATGYLYNSLLNSQSWAALAVDSATAQIEGTILLTNNVSATVQGQAIALAHRQSLAEGYHYTTILAKTGAGGGAAFYFAAGSGATTLTVTVRG